MLPLEPGPLFHFQASKEVPRNPQEAAKRLPRDPRSSPRRSKGYQKEPKRPPKDPRSSPRAPRGRQEAAKMPYDAPKRLPRGFQEALRKHLGLMPGLRPTPGPVLYPPRKTRHVKA